jgi:alkanesulfonate monooxygenase SsuD/methylene tetrahydromethanopterin reductase-like flavin-dependent oxidoreductase (luciferase family)
MNLGLLFPFRNPPQNAVPFAQLYRDHLNLAADAEQLGFDTIWLTEHHFLEDGYSSSLLPIAAAIGARTSTIRIGTFVLLLPLHDPLRVAEDAATVDIISNGRLDLGLGQGYRVPEFISFGIPRKERGARLEEGAELIRRAFTERNFNFEGKYYQYRNITLMPNAVQQPHPPMWLAGRGPKSIGRAARKGYHLMGVGGIDQQQIYDAALTEAGKNPADYNIAQLLVVFVAPTAEKAWDDAEAGIHYMMTNYGKWFAEAHDLPGDTNINADLPPVGQLRYSDTARFFGETLIVGTPEHAIRMLENYRARTRFTHLVMATVLPGVAPQKIRASMELFAREVMPHFQRAAKN